jgi:hypothetical protein
MTSSGNTVPPLIPDASPSQVAAILGAMRAVAETGALASEADRHAITSAGRYLFGHENTGFDAIAPVAPQALVSALSGSRLGEDAAKFLTVMALVDGTLDKAKIASVLRYAHALGLHERYLDDIAAAAADRLQEALADMTRSNMESITGRSWGGGVAKDAAGALDPNEFWHAWAGGAAATVDTFAPGWDFWAYVEVPLRALRAQWSIPAEGLDAQA